MQNRDMEIDRLTVENVRLQAVIAAAREFRDKGTVLTVCNRGPCQRVVEHKDNSDPQAKLFAALKAYDALSARKRR